MSGESRLSSTERTVIVPGSLSAKALLPLVWPGDKLWMRLKRLPANKQGDRKHSLSILPVPITLACLLGRPSFSTCYVPWALRRLDDQGCTGLSKEEEEERKRKQRR
ncbi:hypothetical protein EYF80_055551 [Liparis tanakae]|uniref:Uncharacterized protein n=1 Tax=Liparis tanakae TaxID=230148 RepID=A0A4Z2EZS7_9TELE|nr:hypothetical protein EYF80_055551 [Liparis tanakae]